MIPSRDINLALKHLKAWIICLTQARIWARFADGIHV